MTGRGLGGRMKDGSPHPRGQREEGQQDSSAPLRCARNDMWGGGRWIPAPVFMGVGSTREQRRECGDDGWGLGRKDERWVPASARTTGRGEGMVRV